MAQTYNESNIERARMFTLGVFDGAGHKRKYSGERYSVHCEQVADLVRDAEWDEATIMAAWLHDVVEDSHITLDDVRSLFGCEVCDAVAGVSDIARPEDGARAARARLNAEHVVRSGLRSRAIKLADISSNAATIVARDPKFARAWIEEKSWLVPRIADACPVLGEQAERTIERGIASLAAWGYQVDRERLDRVGWTDQDQAMLVSRDTRQSCWT